MHFGGNQGHIELKDLSEKDFIDLLAAKNQDKRFYEWLHFPHIMEHKTDPFEDLEYFNKLYDNHLFDDIPMEDEDEIENKDKNKGRTRESSI